MGGINLSTGALQSRSEREQGTRHVTVSDVACHMLHVACHTMHVTHHMFHCRKWHTAHLLAQIAACRAQRGVC